MIGEYDRVDNMVREIRKALKQYPEHDSEFMDAIKEATEFYELPTAKNPRWTTRRYSGSGSSKWRWRVSATPAWTPIQLSKHYDTALRLATVQQPGDGGLLFRTKYDVNRFLDRLRDTL